jgi:hypothetical protein
MPTWMVLRGGLGGGKNALGAVNRLRLGGDWLMVVAVSNAWTRSMGWGDEQGQEGRGLEASDF